MKKDQLIKYLSGIKGNPDILFWNSYAQDYHHILAPEVITLYKHKKDYWMKAVLQQRRNWANNQELQLDDNELSKLNKEYSKCEYESEGIWTGLEHTVKKRTSILIQMKPRNKRTMTSHGELIDY